MAHLSRSHLWGSLGQGLAAGLLSIAAVSMLWPGSTAMAADAPAPATVPASRPVLAPGQQVTWSFPALPPTLFSIVLDIKGMPMASAYLPADYTPDRKFPMVVFVSGAQGGAGDTADWPRDIMGTTGYICVSLPSFKESIEPLKEDKSNYWMRMFINVEEGPYIWRSYKVMLEKIYSEIPNIDREHAVFGGFSNGAHTAAALLSNPEEAQGFLGYFHRFVLVEGGHKLKPAADLTGTRFLLMRGGAQERDMFGRAKPQIESAGATWSEFVMPKVGHEYSPEGMAETRKWVQANP